MSSSTPTNSQQAAPLIDSFQPTVRVMRLYKPGFHLVQSFPHMPETLSSNTFGTTNAGCADFTLSPYLLLPDSFGDIYAGEKFSAYIAVVNGFAQVPFYQVTLAVRLQTSTTVIDLADTRVQVDATGASINGTKTLNCNETFDMIVSQTLTELGIHTLRVSVQYLLTPTSEVKTLRKFYRFNVLQPLVIQSSYIELNGKPMVQCEVTNATKSPIYIDELSYTPTSRSSACVPITAAANLAKSSADNSLVLSDAALCEDLKLLLPGESSAFAFMFTEYSDLSGRPPGFPQVKWCTSMGEFSIYRGDFTYPRTTAGSTVTDGTTTNSAAGSGDTLRSIRYECLSHPGELYVGDEYEIVIRVYNTTNRAMSVHLDCKTSAATQPAGAAGPGKAGSGSSMRPRLSTNSNVTYANVLTATSTSGVAGSSKTETGAAGQSASAAATQQQRGLCFCGLTFTPLGIIESLDFSDVTVSVYATSAGQHVLPTLYLIDSITGERHPIEAACSIFVHDNEEWDDEVKSEPPKPAPHVQAPVLSTPAKVMPAAATRPPSVPVPVPVPPKIETKAPEIVAAEKERAAAVVDSVEVLLPPVPPASSMESLELASSMAQFLEESAREIEQVLGTATPSPNTFGMSDAEDIDIEMA